MKEQQSACLSDIMFLKLRIGLQNERFFRIKIIDLLRIAEKPTCSWKQIVQKTLLKKTIKHFL